MFSVQVSKKKYDEDEDFEDSEEAESDISESDFEDPDMMEVSRFFRKFLKKEIFQYCREQCCGSGMFIPDPDFYPYRIPGKTATKEVEKKSVVIPFLKATYIIKKLIILFLNR